MWQIAWLAKLKKCNSKAKSFGTISVSEKWSGCVLKNSSMVYSVRLLCPPLCMGILNWILICFLFLQLLSVFNKSPYAEIISTWFVIETNLHRFLHPSLKDRWTLGQKNWKLQNRDSWELKFKKKNLQNFHLVYWRQILIRTWPWTSQWLVVNTRFSFNFLVNKLQ